MLVARYAAMVALFVQVAELDRARDGACYRAYRDVPTTLKKARRRPRVATRYWTRVNREGKRGLTRVGNAK